MGNETNENVPTSDNAQDVNLENLIDIAQQPELLHTEVAPPLPPPLPPDPPQGDPTHPLPQRLFHPGETIRYKVNNTDWSWGTIVNMSRKSISKYPHWYNFRTLSRGKLETRSIELFPDE